MIAKPHTSKTWNLEPVRLSQCIVEWLIIALVAWVATQSLHDFSSEVQISSMDIVPLTRSADFAGQFLRSAGKIPLWDPFIGNGQPMLESVQSFILNPFMSLPIMLLGVRLGVLLVVLLHAVIFGWGGWVWGRVMGFGSAGRLLMGALLVSSGSFTGALSHGVFQLAMSQAYMPFVYAGLIAMLFIPGQRWGLVLFVVATMLLIFSGTFWYVLPTAVGCGFIALFAILNVRNRRFYLDTERTLRLVLAGLLVVGIVAIRLLTLRRDLLLHPALHYDVQLTYLQVFANYFYPGDSFDIMEWFMVYHYVVPASLMLALGSLSLIFWRLTRRELVGGWRVALAGLLFVLVISFFGTGTTPAVMAVYDVFPFLTDWRNPGRMAAAASPWIVLLAGWCFDGLARGAWRIFTQSPRFRMIGAGALAALLVGGAAGAVDLMRNWTASVVVLPSADLFVNQVRGAHILRERYPSQMLTLHAGWMQHYGLNETLIRHAYGDNEVFTTGLPPTIGDEMWEYVEEFAYGDTPDSGNGIWLREHGYVEMEGVPVLDGIGSILDYNPEALPYAYVVAEHTLTDPATLPLVRSDTLPATYYHRIDQVVVEVEPPPPGSVLVVQETAYPGWTVTVNGESQPIESVHRRIAVRLPANFEPVTVIFSYQPALLYVGALMTFVSILLVSAYALRVDERLGISITLPSLPESVPALTPQAEPVPQARPAPQVQPAPARTWLIPKSVLKYAVFLLVTVGTALGFMALPPENRSSLFLLFIAALVGYELYTLWRERRTPAPPDATPPEPEPAFISSDISPGSAEHSLVAVQEQHTDAPVVEPMWIMNADTSQRLPAKSVTGKIIVVEGREGAYSARITLPPNDEGYDVEFIYPPRRLRPVDLLPVLSVAVTAITMFLSRRSREK